MVEFGRNHENHLFRPIHNVPLNCSLHTTKQYSIIWCENTLKVTPNYRRCILFWSIYEWSEQKNMLRVCVFVVCCFFFSLLIPLYSFTIDDDNDDDCVSLVFRTEPYVLCAKAIVLCIRCLSTTFIYRIEHGNECAPPQLPWSWLWSPNEMKWLIGISVWRGKYFQFIPKSSKIVGFDRCYSLLFLLNIPSHTHTHIQTIVHSLTHTYTYRTFDWNKYRTSGSNKGRKV